jgi:hypothetical protein
VLISPMVEVNRFARYAGLAGLPAIFGRYAKSRLARCPSGIQPLQVQLVPDTRRARVYLVTADLQAAMETVARQGRIGQHVPPVLAFQSVVDDTRSHSPTA